MKVVLKRDEIVRSLQDVVSAIPSRTTLPILSNLLIEAKDDHLRFTATDLEICIRKQLKVNVLEEGKLTVPGKKMYDILREIPSDEVSLEGTKGFGILIKGERCYFKLLGFSADEYPDIPEVEGKDFRIDAQKLKKMLTRTYFACSKEETRYVLNGILFDFKPKRLRLVASDGRRLALAEEEIDLEWEGKYIVPQKAIVELNRIIDMGVVEIRISDKDDQIAFHTNETELITRLIEGDFPNYEEVIPRESPNKVKVDKEEFHQAIKRASLLTTSDSVAVKLEVYKDKVVVSKITPDLGEAREELDVDYKGEEMVIGFNPQFLLDVLKHIQVSEIKFELNGADKPGVIRLDSEYIYLVLPMQLI